ncbi:MAG TPA: ATP-binding protein, partial [Ktedonobacterales bacterium]
VWRRPRACGGGGTRRDGRARGQRRWTGHRAPDELPHLFERFYRARRGLERRSQGTGLGLAICKAFIEAHGGSVAAESGPAGTTIRLTLPVAREEAPPRDGEPAGILSERETEM